MIQRLMCRLVEYLLGLASTASLHGRTIIYCETESELSLRTLVQKNDERRLLRKIQSMARSRRLGCLGSRREMHLQEHRLQIWCCPRSRST